MAELCEKPLYLRAQFNTPDFGGATLGWIDRACHCFTGSHTTVELYRLSSVPQVNITALQKPYSKDLSFRISISYQPVWLRH